MDGFNQHIPAHIIHITQVHAIGKKFVLKPAPYTDNNIMAYKMSDIKQSRTACSCKIAESNFLFQVTSAKHDDV